MWDIGNMLIVVEYDEDMMLVVDYIIDIGLGVGIYGGIVMLQGILEEIMNDENLLMGQYLSGCKFIFVWMECCSVGDCWLEVWGVKENNLKNLNVKILVGVFIVVIGVFGLGKLILINEILYKMLV